MSVWSALEAKVDRQSEKRKERIDRTFDKRMVNEVQRLIHNHSLSQRAAAKECGMRVEVFKSKVAEAIENGVVPEVIRTSNQSLFTLTHMHALMDHWKLPKWSEHSSRCEVVICENQKGGTGKSSTILNAGVAMALPLVDRMRVLIIEIDPQGTLLNVTNPDLVDNESLTTAVDIMLGEEEDGIYQDMRAAGYTHKEILDYSIIETHIPNLKLMPALTSDERFSVYAWKAQLESTNFAGMEDIKPELIEKLTGNPEILELWTEWCKDKTQPAPAELTKSVFRVLHEHKERVLEWMSNNQLDSLSHISYLKEKVVNHLTDDYDVILIDTGPHINPLVWSAQEAATGVLVPVTPHHVDWNSTSNFLNNLLHQRQLLPSKGENIEWLKIAITNADLKNDSKVLSEIHEDFAGMVFYSAIEHSQAFEVAAENFCTVFDIRKAERLVSPKKLDVAVSSVEKLAMEFKAFIKSHQEGL